MLRLLPVLLALGVALLVWRLSSRRLLRDLARRSRPLADPAMTAALAPLAAALGLPAVPVRVLGDAQINGLAAPDGQIYLTEGLLARAAAGAFTPAEVASVIAHELGHVALGHSRRRMAEFAGQHLLRALLAATIGRAVPLVGGLLVQGLGAALSARLSRADEFAADEWAAALMVAAGYGTGPQKRLLAKLAPDAGHTGSAAAEWLRTHPQSAQRIAAIEAHEARWGL